MRDELVESNTEGRWVCRWEIGLMLGELNALVPSEAKPDDIDVLLARLCDRGVWLTDAKRSADDAR